MTTNEESSLPAHPTSQTGVDTSPGAWRTLIEAIEDGVCVQSLDSRIVCANSAFADIIGAPLEQIVGRACAEVFSCANEAGAIPQFCARVAIVQSMLDRAQPPVFNFQHASVDEAIHRAVTLARYQAAKAGSTQGRQSKVEFAAD